MDEAKVKRSIRAMQSGGVTLDEALAQMADASVEALAVMRRLWAEVAAEKPRRKAPSYRDAIEYIALNDEPTNFSLDPESADWVGSQATVHLTAMLFGKSEQEVAEDVVALRHKRTN